MDIIVKTMLAFVGSGLLMWVLSVAFLSIILRWPFGNAAKMATQGFVIAMAVFFGSLFVAIAFAA